MYYNTNGNLFVEENKLVMYVRTSLIEEENGSVD